MDKLVHMFIFCCRMLYDGPWMCYVICLSVYQLIVYVVDDEFYIVWNM